ncbi:MFS transporter [Streptomyces sp. NBS 14/10]|uniref:MFS transporter n=1 Tax=Streptomyces sp. NBS 14/10 TaxID=1945643 RepID=UPI000B7EF92D|nr:MFS transporter [Streptomyces sp. NBS 14/10]KAK1178211.1 MFS transporter [Streptomyces sp. NBS 14/10]NUS84624.1 MFS transporter [Streptomyces sp.]
MSGTTTAGNRRTTGVPRQWRGTGADGAANRWIVLLVLCVSLLLVAVDGTVLHVAVPAVTEDLRPGSIELLWIVDAYPLVCASLLILFGTLGDRVGRRRVLLLGYGLFGVASALAAEAGNPKVLIVARALLGVGGAMIMPATLSILRQVFPDRRERALAIGVWSAVAAVGAAAGPLLGGFLLEHFWWGSVFLINIPLMAVALPVGRWLLPESTGDRDGPWDVLGAMMAACGLFCLVFGVKRVGSGAAPLDPLTAAPALFGVVLLVLFVRRQRRRKHPLVDLRLFNRPAFSISVGCIVLALLALVGLELIAAQYLQLVLGLTPLETGMRLLPLTLAAMAAGLAGSRMLQRLGPRTMVAFGFSLTAAAVLSLVVMGQSDRPAVLVGAFLFLGFGLETTLFGAYESMLNEASVKSAGGAAAIGETSYQLGAGIGIALLGSVMNATYAPGVSHAAGVPESASEAASASLGAAYKVSDRLGGKEGESLRAVARESFVHGLHVTLVVSAGLLLVGALAALRLPKSMECAPDEAGTDAGHGADTGHGTDTEHGTDAGHTTNAGAGHDLEPAPAPAPDTARDAAQDTGTARVPRPNRPDRVGPDRADRAAVGAETSG